MQIQLNGQPFEAADKQTISALLEQVEVGAQRYAVEVNESIVPRSAHATYELTEGDQVEIVVAIGGG